MTRQEASRINGAKSKGPITEEGKIRSSQNATKNGLAAPMLVLRHESEETYHELCEEYRLEFGPQTPAETDIVYEIAASTWRIRRLHSTETSLIDAEIELRRAEVDEQWSNPDDHLRMALAFKSLADSKAYSLLMRYESQLLRSKDRALKQLKKLKDERQGTYPSPGPDSPNEPKPCASQPPNEPEPVSPNEPKGITPNEPKTPQPTPDGISPNEPTERHPAVTPSREGAIPITG